MDPPAESLTDRTLRAAQWRFAAAGAGAVCQFAVGVVLARLLEPAAFGLMTLAFVVLGVARPVGDLGIGAAIVQRAHLTERHVRTAFTAAVLLGIVITIALAGAAPLAAALMRDPAVTSVLRVLALGFGIGATATVANALLRRRLDFRRQFFIDTGSYVLGYGAVAITLAVLGYGVWSLVWGGLIQTIVSSAALLAVARHPVRPLLARGELSELLHFGVGSAAAGWVNYFALNGDNLIVGRRLGAASLGLYSRAYSLMNLPHAYGASLASTVLFPAFAQVQGETHRLRRGYLLATRVTAMIAGPAMALLAIAAPDLVPAVYGPPWAGAVKPLQILCIAGYFRALYHLGGIVAQSVGRVYAELWRQIVYAALVIVGAWVGSRAGLGGVAAGVGIAILYMFFAAGQLALRATETPWTLYLRVQRDAIVTAAATGAAAILARVALVAGGAPTAAVAIGVVAAGAVPWSIGLLRSFGEPDFAPLRARLTLRSGR